LEPIISVEHLTKEFRVFERREGIKGGLINLVKRDYRNLTAVNDVNFTINRGEMVGYIGANGAGKSTTIKMMTGILVPTSGRVFANGYVPYDQRTQYTKTIGVVFGQRTQLWWDIAVVESFYATGTVQPVTEYPIRTGTGGILIDLKVDKGDRVSKGQVLSIVSDPQLQLALDKARAELEEKQKRADEKTSPVLKEFDSKMEAMGAMAANLAIEGINAVLEKREISAVHRKMAPELAVRESTRSLP